MKPAERVEQSTMSKSTTSTNVLNALVSGDNRNSLDKLFPLMDQLIQHSRTPQILFGVVGIFVTLQTLITALWPNNTFYDESDGVVYQVIRYIWMIFFFTDKDPKWESFVISLIVVIVGTGICVIVLAFQIFYYHSHLRFMNWTLTVTSICYDIITPILIYPCSALIGISFDGIVNTGEIRYWVIIFVLVIFYVYLIYSYYLVTAFRSYSAYLRINLLSSSNAGLFPMIMVVNTVLFALSSVFVRLEDWAPIILQAIHIGFSIFALYKTFYFPFYKLSASIIISSILTTNIVMDVGMAVFHWIIVPAYIPLVISITIFAISCVIFFGTSKGRIRRIRRYMNDPKDEPPRTDEEKQEIFLNKGLDRNPAAAMMWLYQGLQHGYDYLIDWSLLKFCYQIGTAEFMCRTAQILAYFPSESRQLGSIFSQLGRRRDLSVTQRFLCYEVYRVKINRQSSISSDATDRYMKLKTQTAECCDTLMSFWTHPTVPIVFAETYANKVSQLRSLWDEALRDYPNNPKLSQEYSFFLGECCTDLEGAIAQAHRCALIEGGHNFSKDTAFRCFVQSYPVYLKKDIVSTRGVFIKKAATHRGSQSNGSTKQNSSQESDTSSMIEIEADVEESYSKKLFKQGHLRLALHNAIKDRTTCAMDCLIPLYGIVTAVTVVLFIAMYFIVIDTFQPRRTSMKRLQMISKIKFNVDMAMASTFLYLAKDNGLSVYGSYAMFPNKTHPNKYLMQKWREEDAKKLNVNPYLDPYEDGREKALPYARTGRKWFNEFLSDLADLAEDGVDVFSLASQLMTDSVNITYCGKPKDTSAPTPVYDTLLASLRTSITVILFNIMYLTGRELTGSFASQHYCETFINHDVFISESQNLFNAFYLDQEKTGDELEHIYMILMVTLGPINFVLLFAPVVVILISYIHELRTAIKALLSVSQSDKDEAMGRIFQDASNENRAASEMSLGISSWWAIMIILFVLTAGIALIGIMLIYVAWDNCNTTNTMNAWLLYSAWRLTGCTGASYKAMQSCLYFEGASMAQVSFVNLDEITTLIRKQLELMEYANNKLMMGNDKTGIPSAYGFDDQLDSYNVREYCEKDRTDLSRHAVYMCASAIQQISVLKDIILEMLNTKRTPMEMAIGARETDIHLVHISSVHIWTMLGNVITRLVSLCEEHYLSMQTMMMTLMIIGVIVTIISFFYVLMIHKQMITGYSTIITLIKRLPPNAIISNKELMDYVTRKSRREESSSMSAYQSVLHHSVNGIVCTSFAGTVEIINPSAAEILSCTPEQLLGQPVNSFFDTESAEVLDRQMGLMRNGEAASTYEDHLILADGVNAAVVVLGMSHEHEGRIESFVLLFQDETEEFAQQKEAEEAKAKSEELLYQILPRDIVLRLNQGEKDICFTVESATIIFVDIVKFSEYAANLTPQEIMGNLSLVFAAFDEIIKKYPLMTKIKLIGDVYMAAAGLFAHPEDDPKDHAMQTVQFALECLSALEDINVKLNANLAVRIGVNSGGPLLAGVLGTDKPVFDIIGDPINVAARLQSTDMPGLVQVSMATKELIEGGSFDITERGEVYLKGKGNQKTFFIQPVSDFMASLSSADIMKTNN